MDAECVIVIIRGETMRFKIAVYFGSFILSHTLNAETLADTNQTVDLMVRLCIAGGHTDTASGTAGGDATISVRSLDIKGTLKGDFTVTKSNAEGLVNGIDNAISQLAANEADKVRDCLKPLRERLLDLLLPLAPGQKAPPRSTISSENNDFKYFELQRGAKGIELTPDFLLVTLTGFTLRSPNGYGTNISIEGDKFILWPGDRRDITFSQGSCNLSAVSVVPNRSGRFRTNCTMKN